MWNILQMLYAQEIQKKKSRRNQTLPLLHTMQRKKSLLRPISLAAPTKENSVKSQMQKPTGRPHAFSFGYFDSRIREFLSRIFWTGSNVTSTTTA